MKENGKNRNYRPWVQFGEAGHRQSVYGRAFHGGGRAERERASGPGHGERRLSEAAAGSGNDKNAQNVQETRRCEPCGQDHRRRHSGGQARKKSAQFSRRDPGDLRHQGKSFKRGRGSHARLPRRHQFDGYPQRGHSRDRRRQHEDRLL